MTNHKLQYNHGITILFEEQKAKETKIVKIKSFVVKF